MIDVKEAVRRAVVFLKDIYDKEDLDDVRLEEVEFLDATREWLITLGYQRRAKLVRHPFPDLAMPAREFKTLTIDADAGIVKSMKIRIAS